MKLVERVSGFSGDQSGSPCWRSVSLQLAPAAACEPSLRLRTGRPLCGHVLCIYLQRLGARLSDRKRSLAFN